jgi:hypothetical protein
VMLSFDGASTSEAEAKAGIDEVFRILGSPQRRTMLNLAQSAFVQRSAWECGCTLHYFVDDGGGGFRWQGCLSHSGRAGASFVAEADGKAQ